MIIEGLRAKQIARAIAGVVVIGVAAVVALMAFGTLLSKQAESDPYPVQGLVEGCSELIESGRLGELQEHIDSKMQGESRVVTLVVAGRTGEIVAAYPSRLVGENLGGFYIKQRYSDIAPPIVFAQKGGPGYFGRVVFQGNDPDSGHISLTHSYVESPDGREYVVLSSWLRSDEFLSRTQWMRRGLATADGILRIAFVLFWLLLPLWVYADARQRGTRAGAWGILTLLTSVVGWSVYVISRPKMVKCPKCGASQDSWHKACTGCGQLLKSTCPQCGKTIEQGWSYCAECGARIQ